MAKRRLFIAAVITLTIVLSLAGACGMRTKLICGYVLRATEVLR